MDPLLQLQRALTAPPDSADQAETLGALRQSLETNPVAIPLLCKTLLPTVPPNNDTLFKRWVLDLVHFGVCRSALSMEDRTKFSLECLEQFAALLLDTGTATVKLAIQIFAGAYPLFFRFFCADRTSPHAWAILNAAKGKILSFVSTPNTPLGIKLCAIKFMQRVILVQTAGVSDPRLQNKADPNLTFCPTDHPYLISSALEAEGQQLITQLVTLLYSSQHVDTLSAILNTLGVLAKTRPSLVEIVVSALAAWTPAALAGQSAGNIRSVEKSVRVLLLHISRLPPAAPFTQTIHNALHAIDHRMRLAKDEEARRAAEANRKRSATDVATTDTKRVKVEQPVASTSSTASTSTAPGAAYGLHTIMAAFPPSPSNPLASFDFTTLPPAFVTDLVIGSLQALTEESLNAAVLTYHRAIGRAPAANVGQSTTTIASGEPAVVVKLEPVDPLKMDIDEEDIEYQPDTLNEQLGADVDEEPTVAVSAGDLPDTEHSEQAVATDFKLPPPRLLSDAERDAFVRSSLARIRNSNGNGADSTSSGGAKGDPKAPPSIAVPKTSSGMPPTEMWMLVLVRMVTRGLVPSHGHGDLDESEEDSAGLQLSTKGKGKEKEDTYSPEYRLRQTLCDFIMEDFPTRARLATVWMNEEWYNDCVRRERDPSWAPHYDNWVLKLVSAYNAKMDTKDKMFSRFLLDLPALPAGVLDVLRELCLDPDKMQAGFSTLRELVALRPPLRSPALQILLALTTHPDKVTRGAAIITVKRWVPDSDPMDAQIRAFALRMLRRLRTTAVPSQDGGGDTAMIDSTEGADSAEATYLPLQLGFPAQKAQVLQHVELLFALSVKVPEFLDAIFAVYGQMETSVQEAVQDLLTPLIRSLGSTHGKLLTLLRTFPVGADSLALRVLHILTENGRPSAQLVALVKSLIAERDLKAPFLIPIIGEMDKADIMKHLPVIVSMLNGKAEEKNLVRSVFSSIVTTPPQSFGSVSSNLPRVRQSELLTPAELMVLLHESEKEIGLKAAIEAIGICFSMADVFRSEVIAVVMQQIVDEPVLPVLFMRTVIQAVTTYKSLIGFVSTTLLSRLITKKIWTNPPLWEGFGRCAKQIAPASFGALLQLPKEQLRELVDKYPGLKSGLRDFVIKKAGNKAKVASYLEVLGGESEA